MAWKKIAEAEVIDFRAEREKRRSEEVERERAQRRHPSNYDLLKVVMLPTNPEKTRQHLREAPHNWTVEHVHTEQCRRDPDSCHSAAHEQGPSSAEDGSEPHAHLEPEEDEKE